VEYFEVGEQSEISTELSSILRSIESHFSKIERPRPGLIRSPLDQVCGFRQALYFFKCHTLVY
jgi:hypothetical protein